MDQKKTCGEEVNRKKDEKKKKKKKKQFRSPCTLAKSFVLTVYLLGGPRHLGRRRFKRGRSTRKRALENSRGRRDLGRQRRHT